MKKTLLFAALAAMSLGATAQTWNFSEWTAGDITSPLTVDGLTAVGGAGTDEADATKLIEHMSVDANNKTIGGVKYTQRIKSNGASVFTDGVLTARYLEFEVTGAGTISYGMCSANSSDGNRILKFVINGDTVHQENAPTAAPTELSTFNYTGEAGTMQVLYTGGINMYVLSYTANGSEDPEEPVDPVDPVDPSGWIFNAANVAVGAYSEDFTEGIYTFVCGGKTWEVDANSCRFETDSTVTYPQRIKAKSKSNQINIAVPSSGTLTFGVRTGSNSDVTRTLVLTQNGTEIYNQLVLEADTVLHEEGYPRAYKVHQVSVPAAGEVVVSMPTGNLNYYFISFNDGSGVEQVFNLDKLFMSNNVVVANGATTVYVYDILGKLVATANASEIDLNKVARGIYVVKAVYADGRTATLKVRR